MYKVDWALGGPIPWKAVACKRAGTIHLGGTLEEIAAAERAPWVCNRVAIIDHGRLLYQGAIEGLIDKDKTIKLTVDRIEEAYQLLASDPTLSVSRNGTASLYVKMADERIPVVNAYLVERGFRVMELSPQRETLEEVFLRLTKPRERTDRYIQ